MEFSNKTREELIIAYKRLEQAYQSLGEAFNGMELNQQTNEFMLRERMKELNCHNRMSEIMSNKTNSVEEVLRKIVEILPEAWQFPEIAAACIQVDGKRYQTNNFHSSRLHQDRDLIIFGQTVGAVTVSYTEKEGQEGEASFLKEEEDLIFSVAVRLSNFLERRHIGNSLQESELKFKNLIENISEVIYEIDNLGIITYISPVVEKLLGYTQEEVIGKKFLQFVGTNVEYLAERFRELFEKGEINHEYEIPAKSGEMHWIRFSTKANVQHGQFLGGTGTLVDISEKRQVEMALLKSEENFRNLVETIKEVVYEVTNEGTIQYISPAVKAVLGYEAEELKGTYIYDLVHETERSLMKQRLSSLVKKDSARYHEYKFLTKTGEICWLRKSTTAIILDDKLVRRVGTLTDVNDQKFAELQVQKSEALYRSILTASPDVITITDLEGKIIFASPKVMEMFGVEHLEAVYGRTLFDFIATTDHARALENITKMMNGHYAGAEEYKGVRSDGGLFDIEVNGEFIRNDEQAATGMIFVTRDISDRKLVKEKLLQSEKQYRAFFEGNYSVMLLIDPDSGEIKDANNAACKYYGWTLEEIRHKHIHEINNLSKEEISEEIKKAMEEKRNHFFFRHSLASGEIRDVEVYAGPMQFGESLMLYSIVHDITDRKKAEASIVRVNRLYAVISQINQAIVRYKDKETLLNETCRIAIEFGQFQMAWIGLVDEVSKTVIPSVIRGNEDGYLSKIRKISLGEGPEGQGPTGIALRNGNWFVCNDIEHDPLMELWRNEAILRGYRSSIALPVTQAGKVVAAISLYSSISNFFNEGEINLLVEVTHNISYALDAIELEKERVHAEEETRKFRTVIDQANYGSAIASLSGEVLYQNLAMAEMHGYELTELKGKNLSVFHNPEQMQQVVALLDKLKITGEFSAEEVWHTRKDGSVFPTLMNASIIFDAEHQPQFMSATAIDITDLKQKEEALWQSEENLNYAQEIANMGSWGFDLKTHRVTWSKNYYRLLGKDPNEPPMTLDEIKQFVHPDDKVLFDEMVVAIIKTRSTGTIYFRLILPGESLKWIQSNIVPIFENDEIVSLSGVSIDITEKRGAEEAIREQNSRLNAIISAIPDMMMVLDKNGTNLEYYTNTEEKLLVPDDIVIGTNMRELFDEVTTKLILGKINECIEKQILVSYEFTLSQGNIVQSFEARLAPLGADRVLTFIRDISDKKKKEFEISRLTRAVEQSPVSIIITDLNANIEYVNPAFEETSGYTFEEVKGQSASMLGSGETGNSLYGEMWRSISVGGEWNGEWINKKKNGERYWENVSISPIHEENGLIVNYLAVKQDITLRKQAEEEIRELNENLEQKIRERTEQLAETNQNLLHEIEERKRLDEALIASEQSYRTVVENVNEVIFQTDAEGLWVFLNKSWEAVTGFSVIESLGKPFLDYVHPEDRERNNDLFMPLIKREKEYCRHEVRYLTKDGNFRWIEVFARLGLNEKDEITGTFGTLQDITLRRLSEEALAQMSSRLNLALRAGGIGVWDYDVVNNVLVWDNQMFAIYGIRAEDFSSAYDAWINGLHPEDKIRGDEEIQMAIRGEREFDTEFRVVWPDGSVHYVRALATVERDSLGQALRMIGTNWDITLGKQAENFEKEMLQLSAKLTGVAISEIDSALKLALLRIGQFLNADRAYIFEIKNEEATMSNTNEWCNEGILPEIENLQDIPCAMLPRWMEVLNDHENIVVPSVRELPESWSAERAILEPQGIQSLVVIPLLVENALVGFVGLDSVKSSRTYNTAEINILKVWSSMLSSLVNKQRTERLLEQTRQNYETFFNTIDDFLWVLDEKGKIIHTNNTVKKRLEYSEEELFNESVLLVHPAERREEAGRIVGEMLAGISEFCPVPVVTKSGAMIPVETRVKSGFWNGLPVIFGVSKDISKVQLSEQKFSSAFQSNSAMMAISYFESGQHLEVNNSFIETMGYSRDELIGKTNEELGLFVDPGLRSFILEQLKNNSPVRKMEMLMRTKDGTVKTGLLSADSIFIGQNRCLLTVNMDITERKRAEDDLKRARMEADQANLAKSEFLSRMSHELRTPMNSILGFAQLLDMGDLHPGQKKGVSHIMRSGKHLLDLINEVLDISRIEAGHLSLSLEPLRVRDVIHEILEIVRLQANERKINLELLDSGDNHLYIKSDKQRLKQILLNLIGNAIKYNKKEGSVFVSAQLMPKNATGVRMVRIAVKDTGLGISATDLPKLFQPFERIGAEKTETEGTGLGLSVVKKLVEAMHGAVGVESIPTVGSTFWIEFPWSNGLIEPNEKNSILDGLEKTLGNKKGVILYIEDNLSNVELVGEILASQRSKIRLISDSKGKMAVDLAAEFKPDLILLDLNLPDMHGSEVFKLLQAEESTKNIPVVVISADAMPRQIEKMILDGAKNYLTKPIDLNILLKIIDEFVD